MESDYKQNYIYIIKNSSYSSDHVMKCKVLEITDTSIYLENLDTNTKFRSTIKRHMYDWDILEYLGEDKTKLKKG